MWIIGRISEEILIIVRFEIAFLNLSRLPEFITWDGELFKWINPVLKDVPFYAQEGKRIRPC